VAPSWLAADAASCRLHGVDVYLEVGTKRVFAGATGWPGWNRSGRDEGRALEALAASAPRYAAAVGDVSPRFVAPASVDDLEVVERVEGDATTDFGAPSIAPEADRAPVDKRELVRLQALLERAWAALDRVAEAAEGVELTTGPRGGGRVLDAIVAHVIGAETSYIGRLAAPRPRIDEDDPRVSVEVVRTAAQEALARAVLEGLPETGPRGGAIWTPRYFVRRTAWHALDHAWEIEDRSAT
jgi:hypothetical protein